jgi:hypothetical protein
MKGNLLVISAALVAMGLLSSCTNRDSSTVPSLSEPSAPTTRMPSPSNNRANAYMQGSQMTVPTRQ